MIACASLKNRRFADIEQSYDADDAMQHALGIGIGFGADPLDAFLESLYHDECGEGIAAFLEKRPPRFLP